MTPIAARKDEALAKSALHFTNVDGVGTRYFDAGQGENIVFIHGGHYGFSDAIEMWSMNLGALSAGFRVLALDRLGQGWTDNPRSDADFTFDASYQHLAAWIRTLGIERAHVVGHSRGALFAARLALEQPRLVQSLVLVDTRTLSPVDAAFPPNQPYKDAVRAATAVAPTRETVRVEPDENSYSREHVSDELVDRLLEIYRSPKTEWAQRRMDEIEESVFLPSIDRNREQVLGEIASHGFPMPTLMVWGANDPTAQLGLGLRLFDWIRARTQRLEFHVLNNAGHYSFREKADEFNRLIRSFCGGAR